jgi:hypothetical protein
MIGSGGNSGIDVLGAVFIVFLVLKLIGTITWPWLWVTAPLWVPLAALIAGAVWFMGYQVFRTARR